jgi:hypothetical protein
MIISENETSNGFKLVTYKSALFMKTKKILDETLLTIHPIMAQLISCCYIMNT